MVSVLKTKNIVKIAYKISGIALVIQILIEFLFCFCR